VDTIDGPESTNPANDLNADPTHPTRPDNDNTTASNSAAAAKKIERAALGGEETVEEVLSKPPEKLSETEVNRLTRVKGAMLSNDPNRARTEQAVTQAHRNAFTDDGEAGQTFALDVTPALTPTGQPVTNGIKQVVATFFGSADDSGIPGSVSTLQSTLNNVEKEALPLKVDGIFGDKTRNRLRATIAQKGPEPILDDFGSSDEFDIFDNEDAA
jgi:hypothetical protein